MSRIRVLTLNAALGPLDYRLPHGMAAEPGSIVVVPLGPRQIAGVVWEENAFPETETVGDNRLRPISGVVDAPPLPAPLRRLIEWTANYYLAPPAAVLRMAIASVSALEGARTVIEYRATGKAPARNTEKRAQALERIGERQGLVKELAMIGGVSDAVIRGLVKDGALEGVEVSIDTPYADPDPGHLHVDLSHEQAAAADRLIELTRAGRFQTVLLDGVTGSGKTEVYFEAVAEALRMGRQTLVLLPEIALTEPFLTRFAKRFGHEPVAWHSGLRQSERRRAWRAIADGSARVVVGARSALFLPYARLGLIVVDEAHETSFKQEDGVRYHARDVAVMRGLWEQCPVLLASATPAIETRHQVALGRYEEIRLPGRYGGAEMPEIVEIDLLQYPPERGRWIAPPLVKAMEQTLEKGEQALLFLNRRGYAPLTLCRHCGHRFQCPNCTAWMVEHRLTHRLACHHCGHVIPAPKECPECHADDSLVACGPGVERIADEVKALFPEARTAIVTSDTLWSPAKAAEFVRDVAGGAVDIIVGTQLVTKGYHFPNLTLVGVIDADLGLEGGDLRAAERTFQQIVQVSGRAGRGEKPGRVFIQTRLKDAPVIKALLSGDSDRFYATETEGRRIAHAPPFGRFAAIIVSDTDQQEAKEAAHRIGNAKPTVEGVEIYGPAPAPLAVLRGRHRHRILIHARRQIDVQDVIREWLGKVQWKASTRVAVDIDPYSFV
ncbi:MAG: primosomal protein N' [Sphingobium sp.]